MDYQNEKYTEIEEIIKIENIVEESITIKTEDICIKEEIEDETNIESMDKNIASRNHNEENENEISIGNIFIKNVGSCLKLNCEENTKKEGTKPELNDNCMNFSTDINNKNLFLKCVICSKLSDKQYTLEDRIRIHSGVKCQLIMAEKLERRRQLDRDRQKLRRESLSNEQKEIIRAKDREAKQKKRRIENDAEAEQRKGINREAQRKKISKETPEEAAQRRAVDREAHQRRRWFLMYNAIMSEKLERIRRLDRERHKRRRQALSPEEKELIKAKNREAKRLKRNNKYQQKCL